jgi:HAD superfamily hydrolase (TIGR01484 family)
MRYLCLATDYDGTLAHHGRVTPMALAALERLRASGRKLLLVTGRELDDLHRVFAELAVFDWIVAENGALLYQPATREMRMLGPPPDAGFIEELQKRGVADISVGHVIVATWEPYESLVLETIRDLGLGLQVIFNKGAVMALPSGITKASGLAAVLKELGISRHNVVGVGDAENDHALLDTCHCGVAVANAVPALKEHADWIAPLDHAAGVEQLIDRLLQDDLRSLDAQLKRHGVTLGERLDGEPIPLAPFGPNLLVAGSSGSGKSSFAVGLLERLHDAGYQCCVVDPEGDYSTLEGAVAVGTSHQAPDLDEVMQLLKKSTKNIVVNLEAVRLADRPAAFSALLSRLQEVRVSTGRPHWIAVDEAHHVLPADRHATSTALPQKFEQLLLITVEPETVLPAALADVDRAVIVGQDQRETLAQFCRVVRAPLPSSPAEELSAGQAMLFTRSTGTLMPMQVIAGRTQRRRHRRKYSEGDLGADRSFYFRGPQGKLNLRAQNLTFFLQLAEGVDDETWLFHLQRGDYSRWFREGVKDDELADRVVKIEQDGHDPALSRQRVKQAIEEGYTLPARG